MERYVFIHGSSVGQSSFIPSNAPKTVCIEIADSYFKGRELRCKESDAGKVLFVELCKGNSGNSFVCYSYVNNKCIGASTNEKEGRKGQYFSISVLSSVYVFPELVCNLLEAAYEQLFEGKIIDKEGQFLIGQFDEKKNDFQKAVEQIEKFFGEFSQSRLLKSDGKLADYVTWKGEKYNLDTCNSEAAFEALCKQGRIYVSKEFESPNAKILSLEKRIKELQKEKAEIEEKSNKANSAERSKARQEIEDVGKQLKDEKSKNDRLQADNNKYKESLEVVKKELDKYGKIGESIHELQGLRSKYEKKDRTDILKIILLFVILIFTLISSILNYTFFRNLSSDFKKGEKTEQSKPIENESEESLIVNADNGNNSNDSKSVEVAAKELTLDVLPNVLTFEATDRNKIQSISVTTKGTWNCPNVPEIAVDWLELSKENNELKVKVKSVNNSTTNDRTAKFFISAVLGAQQLEQQITITQKKKVESELKITVTKEGKECNSSTKVKKGDVLIAKVPKGSLGSWELKGFSDLEQGREKWGTIPVTVTATEGAVSLSFGTATISFEVEKETN